MSPIPTVALYISEINVDERIDRFLISHFQNINNGSRILESHRGCNGPRLVCPRPRKKRGRLCCLRISYRDRRRNPTRHRGRRNLSLDHPSKEVKDAGGLEVSFPKSDPNKSVNSSLDKSDDPGHPYSK